MAKKKDAEEFPCQHCGAKFKMMLCWCPRCKDHMLGNGFLLGKDVCDRCHNGENDHYLELKKGRAERIAKALEEAHLPERIEAARKAVADFELWCASDAYRNRFAAEPQPTVKMVPRPAEQRPEKRMEPKKNADIFDQYGI